MSPVTIYKDEADGLFHWWCRSARGYLTEDDAYTAAVVAHPDTIVTVEKEAEK